MVMQTAYRPAAQPVIVDPKSQAPAAAYKFSYAYLDSFLEYLAPGQEKTAKVYLTNLRSFAAYLLYRGITAPQRADIIAYRNFLSAEHEVVQLDQDAPAGWSYRTGKNGEPVRIACRPATVRLYLQTVKQFFAWTSSAGIYPNIAAGIKGPKVDNSSHKRDALTAPEVLTIEENLKARTLEAPKEILRGYDDPKRTTEQQKRLLAMFLLATNCGLRTIELSRAKVKDLESKNGKTWLYVYGKGRTEPDQKKSVAPEVAAVIKDYLKSRADKPTKESPLFCATGNRSGGKPLLSTTISTMLKQALQDSGFDSPRLTAHSLRHTTGTAMHELTGSLYRTQEYMRHMSPCTTEIYIHDIDRDGRETVDAQRLYDYFHGKQEDGKAALDQATQGLTPEQLKQLADIARNMQHH